MSRNKACKRWFVVVTFIIVCLAVVPVQAGTAWPERQKLLASDGAVADFFGWSVSISGDLTIVGAYCDDDNGSYSGSAYIFKWDGESWSQQQKLLASDGAFEDYFGYSVSITSATAGAGSGDFAIVGAYGDGYYIGAAYIFAPNDVEPNNWDEKAKLLASDGADNDNFGMSVSIDGNYAIVGAYCDDDNGGNSGAAYIFAPNDVEPNNWDEKAKLLASDGANYDYFGCSVSISGDLAIVGAYGDDDNGTTSGSAYIFKRSDNVSDPNWYEQCKLLPSDGANYDEFGRSVSISGDYAIVGAYRDDDNGGDSGSAYIFTPNDIDPNNWVQQAKLLASDGAINDHFGWSVSITSVTAGVGSGDFAIVGAHGDDDKGDWTGSAYVFKWDGESWSQQQKLLDSDGFIYDHFGRSVSISGDTAIVGMDGDDDNGDGSGSAYIYFRCADWLTADLYGDCFVDFKDFSIFGNQWLQMPGYPSVDLAPEGGDGVVNFLDLDILVEQWLKCGDPCDPNCQP